jgi:pentatricopeptide repeat protein
MRACTAANQPEAGILLAKRLEGIVTMDKNKGGAVSLGSAMSSFFVGVFDSQSGGDDSLLADATVLAETVNAYRAMNMPDQALDLLRMIPESFGKGSDDGQWTPVINAAIRLLSEENRTEEARQLFEEMDKSSQNHETLLAMATGLEKDKEWREIIKLFYRALESGLLSERLGVLGMKAVVESRSDGQMHNLRYIVKNVCALSGLTEKQWLESHYWHLERALSWDVARMLMWWGDPVTSKEMKLQFAIKQSDARQKAGLTPKNDILRFIVFSAREYREPTELMPFSREEWLGLLRGFLMETESSALLSSPKFIESGCKSLLWLGGNEECVEFVSSAVARGVRITNETVIEATRAAQEANLEVDKLSMLNHVGA